MGFIPIGGFRGVFVGGPGGASYGSDPADWTPAEPTTDGAYLPHLWLKADAGVLDAVAGNAPVDGGVVGQWRDQSGNNNHVSQATGANKPTWQNNELNGNPVIRNDATDYLQGAFASGALSQSFTIFAVGKLDASVVNNNATNFLWDSDDTTNRGAFYEDQAGAATDKWTIFAGVEKVGTIVSDSDWHVFAALYKGATSQIWIDNVSAGVGDAGAHNPDGFTVGARFNGISNWVGDYAEFIIYDHELSIDDRNDVVAYLNNKYGFT